MHFPSSLVALVRNDTKSEYFPDEYVVQGEYLIWALIRMVYSVSRVNEVRT